MKLQQLLLTPVKYIAKYDEFLHQNPIPASGVTISVFSVLALVFTVMNPVIPTFIYHSTVGGILLVSIFQLWLVLDRRNKSVVTSIRDTKTSLQTHQEQVYVRSYEEFFKYILTSVIIGFFSLTIGLFTLMYQSPILNSIYLTLLLTYCISSVYAKMYAYTTKYHYQNITE
jgi:hypothetical protein